MSICREGSDLGCITLGNTDTVLRKTEFLTYFQTYLG